MSEIGVLMGRDGVWEINQMEDLEAMLSLVSLWTERKQIPPKLCWSVCHREAEDLLW